MPTGNEGMAREVVKQKQKQNKENRKSDTHDENAICIVKQNIFMMHEILQ
jgi:hypothetical protein